VFDFTCGGLILQVDCSIFMSTFETSSMRSVIAPKFHNGEDFVHGLGDVPLSRIIFDPWPGTATEEDLLRLVEGDTLCELVDGTLVEKPVGYEKSLIAKAIAHALENFVRPRKLGLVAGADATLRLTSGSIRLPDVSFISVSDLPGGKRPKVKVPRLPITIAVEVISEGNTRSEMRRKSREYFESGSKLIWLIYPKSQTIAVFESLSEEPTRILSKDEILDGGSVLPGFSMSVSEVFRISDFE
jgi:Uma2 family endonuclease